MSKENIKNFIDSLINKNENQSKVDFHAHINDWFRSNLGGDFKMKEVDLDPKRLDPNLGMVDDNVDADEESESKTK